MNQTLENLEKSNIGPNFVLFDLNKSPKNFFREFYLS